MAPPLLPGVAHLASAFARHEGHDGFERLSPMGLERHYRFVCPWCPTDRLDETMGYLVGVGVPEQVQQAWDIVRGRSITPFSIEDVFPDYVAPDSRAADEVAR